MYRTYQSHIDKHHIIDMQNCGFTSSMFILNFIPISKTQVVALGTIFLLTAQEYEQNMYIERLGNVCSTDPVKGLTCVLLPIHRHPYKAISILRDPRKSG